MIHFECIKSKKGIDQDIIDAFSCFIIADSCMFLPISGDLKSLRRAAMCPSARSVT
jgi:hypothetical protein